MNEWMSVQQSIKLVHNFNRQCCSVFMQNLQLSGENSTEAFFYRDEEEMT